MRIPIGSARGEVLAVHKDEPPIDASESADHSIAEVLLLGKSKLHFAMGDERVDLGERSVVEKEVEPLSR